jgi:hypothetical protein
MFLLHFLCELLFFLKISTFNFYYWDMKRSILSFLFLFCFVLKGFSFTYTISSGIHLVRHNSTLFPGVPKVTYNLLEINSTAGDVLVFANGTRGPLKIENMVGDSLNPITIKNGTGIVNITKPVGGYYGLAISNCRYIHINGRSSSTYPYGIRVSYIPNGAGLGIDAFSSNVETEGMEIDHMGAIGIAAKTDPNCANLSTYPFFTMYDMKFHHNYIHHVGTEAFYIGNTGYYDGVGLRLVCGSTTIFIKPHKIIGVRVYENMIDSTGWDGIQVAMSQDCEIYSNYITNDSYADQSSQMGGITIGQPTIAKVYNNIIKNSVGTGIASFSTGTQIFNNVIKNPGLSKKAKGTFVNGVLTGSTFLYGIYINDKACKDTSVPRLPFVVVHNTIVIGKTYKVGAPYNSFAPQGINLNSLAYVNNSFIGNNLIVIDSATAINSSPLSGIYSSNSVPGYSQALAPAFISLNSRSVYGPNFYGNESNTIDFVSFNNDQYALNSTSPAVDAAAPSVINNYPFAHLDIDSKQRPSGAFPDFGAYEQAVVYSYSTENYVRVFPNPARLAGAIINTTIECAADLNLTQVELRLSTLDSSPVLIQSMIIPASECNFTGELVKIPANWQNTGLYPGLYVIEVYVDQVYAGAVRILMIH